MKKVLVIIAIFLFGVFEGFLIQKAFFPNTEVKHYDTLSITATNEIKLEESKIDKTLTMSYDTFKYIIEKNIGEVTITKVDALFYRIDGVFPNSQLSKTVKVKENKQLNKKIKIPKLKTPGTCNWQNCSV